ncbi:MAG: hypothetical protein ACK4ZJ_18390, partial [Allorhizobium sp.]
MTPPPPASTDPTAAAAAAAAAAALGVAWHEEPAGRRDAATCRAGSPTSGGASHDRPATPAGALGCTAAVDGAESWMEDLVHALTACAGSVRVGGEAAHAHVGVSVRVRPMTAAEQAAGLASVV